MRLGVVGMLPADFREITDQHLAQIAALKLTAGAFHAPGAMLAGVTAAEAHAVRDRFAGAGMDLAQFGIGFSECLFDPAQDVRDALLATIGGGLRVAADLAAVEANIEAHLGLSRCFRDPGVGFFGLDNALYPVGHQLL
ncbi:MAG: hypothetical protein QGG05_05620, partial [Candidatus Latescibacteria bacterium]|nr:hypothetical protein [Candidatus Latescibacterota bacterium]